jgi:hypothetical protein
MLPIAQITEAAEVAKQAISAARSDVALMFITLLVVGATLFVIYVYFIAAPNAKQDRESKKLLVEAVAKIGDVMTDTHSYSKETHETVERLRDITRPCLAAMEKIARKFPELELTAEIGEMRGVVGHKW